MDEPYLRHRQACYWKKISPSVWQWSIADIGCGLRDITVMRNPKLPALPLIRSEWTTATPTNQAAGFYRHTTSNSSTTESASSTATLFCDDCPHKIFEVRGPFDGENGLDRLLGSRLAQGLFRERKKFFAEDGL